MNKWECIKLKSFCITKETVTGSKTAHTMGENLCQLLIDKGLYSRIYRELNKLNFQKINIPMKKWVHELNRESSKEEVQMASK
jgi:hypothetical protein